jgi:hypothetical protein
MDRRELFADLQTVRHDRLGGMTLWPFVFALVVAAGIGLMLPLITILMLTMA